jgi:hypothetical protein
MNNASALVQSPTMSNKDIDEAMVSSISDIIEANTATIAPTEESK